MQVDYTSRLKFRDKLKRFLFTKPQFELRQELIDIISQNSRMYDNYDDFLTHRGKVYRYGAYQKPARGDHKQGNPLHPSLRQTFRDWIRANEELQIEEDLAVGYLDVCMARTDNINDFRLLLPPAVDSVITYVEPLFHGGPGKFTTETAKLLMEEHSHTVKLMKLRLTMNMLAPKSSKEE